jgi:hypothetical protein
MRCQINRRVVAIAATAAFVAGCGAASTTSVHRNVPDSTPEAVPASTGTALATVGPALHVTTAPVMSTAVPGRAELPHVPGQ